MGVQREEAPRASLPASRGARQPWVRLGYGGSITPNSASPHAACLPPSFPFFLSTFPPHLLQWETNGQFMEVMGSQRHLKTLRPAPAARSSLCSRRTCPGGSRAVKPAARGVGLRGRREVVGVKPIARPGPGSTKEGRGARGQSYNF